MAGESPLSSGVPVWNPEGALVRIPALDQSALMQGYRPATPEDIQQAQDEEQYGGALQGLASFGEGAASAMTFGLSPKIETATGLTTPDAIRGREEVHPLLHGLGTATGVILPLALSGGADAPAAGASLASRVASKTAPALIARAGRAAGHLVEGAGLPGALGRLAPTAAMGATEGALYAGSELTEKALLGDPEITWEKTAAELGLAALFGGAMGVGFKALSDVIPDNLGEKASDWLGETAAHRNIKAAGAIKDDITRALKTKSREQLDKIGEEFGTRGLVGPLTTPPTTLERAQALIQHGKNEARLLIGAADETAGAPRWTWQQLREDIEPQVIAQLKGKGSTIRVAEAMRSKLDDFSAAYHDKILNVSDLYALRQDLDHSIYQYGKSLDPFVKPVAAPLKLVRDHLADTLENAMEDVGLGADPWREAMRKMEVGILARQFARRGMLRQAGNNPVPLTAILGAIAGGSAFSSPAGAVLTGAGTFLARRYGSGTMGWAAGTLKRLIDSGMPEKEALAAVRQLRPGGDIGGMGGAGGLRGIGGGGGAGEAAVETAGGTAVETAENARMTRARQQDALDTVRALDEDDLWEQKYNLIAEGRGSEEAVAAIDRQLKDAGWKAYPGDDSADAARLMALGSGPASASRMEGLFARVQRPDGGFTYNPAVGTEPVEGYALSIHPERSVAIDASKIKITDLADYVAKNGDILAEEGNHFGAWHDPASGKVFLDVSTVTKDAKAAEDLARRHDQIAYFDLKRGQSVTVNPVATSGGAYGQKGSASPLAPDWRSGQGPGAIGSALSEAHGQEADPGGARRGVGHPEVAASLKKRVAESSWDFTKDRITGQVEEGSRDLVGSDDTIGAATRVITPRFPFGEHARYALVEADELIPSHSPQSFKPNRAYPEGVQERTYHLDVGEKEKVSNGGKNLKPSLLLTDSPTAVDGPPLVTAGKPVVLGGNGRTMMIQRAFENDQVREAYRAELAQKAAQFGLKPETVKAMKAPVLVRVLPELPDHASKEQLTAAVRRFNEGMTQGLSTTALAVAEARALSPETMTAFGTLLSSSEDASLRDLMRSNPQAFVGPLERDGIITAQGRSRWLAGGELTDEGKDRIEGMFLGRIMGTADRLEATAPALRAKVERATPFLLAVASVNPQADEIGTVREAVDMLSDARRRGLSLKDLIAQRPLFGAEIENPEAEVMAALLDTLGPKAVGTRFEQWAELAAYDPRQATMFGQPPSHDQIRAVLFGNMPAPQPASELAPTGAHERILKLTGSADRKLKNATRAILGGEPPPEKFAHGGLVTPENYTDVASSLRGYGNNLDRLAEDVSKQTTALQDHAPATASAAHAFAARVVSHLVPRLPDAGPRQLLDAQYQPSATELAAYNRHHEVAARGPVAVLEHLARGTLHPDHVQASQELFPRLHAETQQMVAEKIAEHMAKKQRIPIALRSGLSLLLGTPLEHAQTPAAVLSAQLTYQQAAAAAPPPAPSSSRNVETHFDQREETASQGNETRMRKA